jgi:hypothetical protein
VVEEQPTEHQPGGRPDETARIPRPDEPAPQAAASDGTTVLPAAAQTQQQPKWSARAGVPAGPRQQEQEQWVPERAPSRFWWTPVLIGILVLVLVGLIGLGLWLALRGSTPAPTPTGTPSAVPTTASPTPSPTPTPSPSASVATVPVPPLANVAVSDALPILQGQGLVPKVVTEVNDSVPAGTVIGTDPPAGTQVPVGSTVTVHVATASPSPSPSPSSVSPSDSG